MMHAFARFITVILCFFVAMLDAVGPVVPGQALWCISKRIGSTVDVIESKVCLIDIDVSDIQETLCSKLEILDETVDGIESKACDIESKIDLLDDCDPTPFTASTTIDTPGFYCLSESNNTGIITVQSATNDVVVDLNGHRVQGVVIEQNDQVRFFNGTIVGDSLSGFGIDVQSGSSNIALESIEIQNAQIGAHLTNVTGGLIAHCSMSQNITGLELDASHKITIENSTADCNINAGFCLLSSTTNCLRDCKALSTGQGNAQTTDQTIFGFVATNGYGNIFENCIANSTQGLNVTDYDSLIAGFALRGTEGCSKIIACEAANSIASGVNVPYGILLEGRFDTPLTLTGSPPVPAPSDAPGSVDWTSDSKYIAIEYENTVAIYTFNRQTGILSRVASAQADALIQIIDWHPNNRLLAVGQEHPNPTLIFEFCPINNTLTRVASQAPQVSSVFRSLAWHPSGNYLAIGEGPSTGTTLYAYKFDVVANSFELLGSHSFGTNDVIKSLGWSPDGDYIAVDLDETISEVYSFDPSSSSPFTFFSSLSQNIQSDQESQITWSPDGKYIGNIKGSTGDFGFYVYSFDATGATFRDFIVLDSTGGGSFDWSNDSRYIVLVGQSNEISSGVTAFGVFEFDRDTQMLELVPGTVVDGDFRVTRWSPDGEFFAVSIGTTPFFGLYEALTFPSKNVIKDNVVYCNANNDCGIGISGSSIANLIIGNTAYSNPTSFPEAGIGTNYAFVTNVFDQRYGQGPTALQNISIGCSEPICMPDDLGLLSKQLKHKACDLISQIDVITSKVSNLESSLDNLMGPCDPTAISSGPITAPGFYCLSADATGPFAITASNVVLDLNGRKITNGVTISGQDQIRLFNGTIEGTSALDGIDASNATNINLDNVTIKNSLVGVNFNAVIGGTIANCSLTQNVTGLELDQSAKIVVDHTVASCNINAGFCLISSTTNCLRNCKALSTGQGNSNVLNQTIFGFVSANGHGNIFERCIANSTQALSTTDYDSVIAGFALRGTEGCSKIIDCEAANATANESGVTVPHGILLQATFDELVSVTSINPGGGGGDTVLSTAWSPDGKHLAVGGFISDNNLHVYSFDYQSQELIKVDSVNPGGDVGATVIAVSWSPDGKYLAVGGTITGDDLYVYSFDRGSQALTQVHSVNSGGVGEDIVYAVSWSPDGKYLAVGGQIDYAGSGDDLYIYSFDRGSQTLTQVDSVNPGGVGEDDVQAVSWSPDGKYLAVGGRINYPGSGDDLYIYSFDRSSQSLTQVDSVNPGGLGEDFVHAVSWSPDGKYLAVGGAIDYAGSGDDLYIYSFDRGSQTLDEVNAISVNPGGVGEDDVQAVSWSPDGKYLAVGGAIDYAGSGDDLYIYSFDRGSQTLDEVDSVNPGLGADSDVVRTVAWSPDGRYLAAGGTISGDGPNGNNDLIIYEALSFPTKNVIKSNTVYCNSTGGDCPRGVGISGSSIANLIIQNTSYSNPIGPVGGISQNYNFATNVFNQQFGQEPTLLQNIALGCNEPICQPADLALLAKQICNKLEGVSDCAPTSLSQNDVVGGTISLTSAGNYCLSEPVTADMQITATSVTVDLNNNCLTGVILIMGDDARVHNGNVIPPAVSAAGPDAGIDVLAGAQRALIEDVVVDASTAPTFITTGRAALRIAGIDTQVHNCILTAGASAAQTGAVNGDMGGSGIVLRTNALRTLIRNCTIAGGDGGDGGTVSTFGNGGDGGHGIEVQSGSVQNVEIDNCLICKTGQGGAPGTLNGSREGGRGGDGISIDPSATGVAAHNCIIRNAGCAGLSAAEEIITVIDLPDPTPDISVIDTADGKAVDDLVTAADQLSVIFANFADTIKNPIVYNLNNRRATPSTDPANGDGGVLVSNPPDATAGGGNVIVNHIVNVFMDAQTS